MRTFAAGGFALVTLMFVIFFLLGQDRPTPYREIQALATIASLGLVVGALRGADTILAIGFGANALARAAQIGLGLSRLPFAVNVLLAAAWIWAGFAAARGRSLQAPLWTLAFAHVLSLVFVLSRFEAALALTLGAAGLFLAAPNTRR